MKYGYLWIVYSKNGIKNREEIKVKYFIKLFFFDFKVYFKYFNIFEY